MLILDTLKDNSRVEFNKLVFGFQDKMHGVMTFLAGLELTRRRVLFLRQTRPFQELWMYRRNDEAQEEPFPEELADDFGAPDEPSTDLEPEEGVDA